MVITSFPLPKKEAGRLNTLVNFQPIFTLLNGQFSADDNNEVLVAPGALGNPMWPENSMRDLLALAFGETFTIRELSHPVIKRLLGQS